jgi:TonB family protein
MSVALSLMLMQMAGAGPLQPTNKWMVEYEESMCTLGRQFGTGDTAVTFGLKPNGLVGETAQVILLYPDKGSRYPQAYSAKMELQPSGAQFPVEVQTSVIPKKGMRIVQFTVAPAAQKAMALAQTLILPTERGQTISIAPGTLRTAMGALDVCQRDLLVSYGVDRTALSAVVEPAEAMGAAYWITTDDYPDSAIRDLKSGMVTIVWRITPEGRVDDCRIVQPAKDAIFGEVSCALITRRGRYKPARDMAGKPVSSWGFRRVNWVLPS